MGDTVPSSKMNNKVFVTQYVRFCMCIMLCIPTGDHYLYLHALVFVCEIANIRLNLLLLLFFFSFLFHLYHFEIFVIGAYT